MLTRNLLILLGCLVVASTPRVAADWASWRGPEQNGTSRETGLPESFNREGDNVLWRAPVGARSTPIVLGGRVFLLTRGGDGKTLSERVVCLDAENGAILWEQRFGVYLSDVPPARLGWSSACGDPETGQIYVHGSQGLLIALDRDGNLRWQRSLHEEFGLLTGHGGRTSSPVIDKDLVIVGFVGASWGSHTRLAHRYLALDKLTGQVVWWSEPGDTPRETTCSVPVIAVVEGTRLLIDGNADGNVYALKARTGEKVWTFRLSLRGLNTSVVVWNNRVYACHGAENLEGTRAGRVVCFDATGQGDITSKNERWRVDGILAGVSSPALADGTLYVTDNSARLHAIDAESGKVHWRIPLGTSMRGSPVAADGKLYLGEVNGRFFVLRPEAGECKKLCEVTWPTTDGSVVELNGSPAVSDGRVFFATSDELYAVGSRAWTGTRGTVPPASPEEPASAQDAAAHLQVVPSDIVLQPGQSAFFTARLFDARGRLLRTVKPTWSPRGLKGTATDSGKLTIAKDATFGAGTVEARVEKLVAEARVRVAPTFPLKLDFETLDEGAAPPGWIAAAGRFQAATVAGQKVLRKAPVELRSLEAEAFFGLPTWKDYTIQADVLAGESRGQLPSLGLINSGYQLLLLGNHQRLRLVSWVPAARVDSTAEFAWKAGTWYTMKLRSRKDGDSGRVEAKAWPRDEKEPTSWLLTLDDPLPQGGGSPGLQAYSAGTTSRSPGAEVYFDNVTVEPNQ